MQTEIQQKMAKLNQLSDAICLARAEFNGTPAAMLQIQRLEIQRSMLASTLPIAVVETIEERNLQQRQQQQGKAT